MGCPVSWCPQCPEQGSHQLSPGWKPVDSPEEEAALWVWMRPQALPAVLAQGGADTQVEEFHSEHSLIRQPGFFVLTYFHFKATILWPSIKNKRKAIVLNGGFWHQNALLFFNFIMLSVETHICFPGWIINNLKNIFSPPNRNAEILWGK